MLDNDNMISTSVSEVIEKIPTDEKDHRKCYFMCFIFKPQTVYQQQHIANSRKVIYVLGQ